jgi:integrase/recombinase XerD
VVTPKVKDSLAQRILEIEEVRRLIEATKSERDFLLLSLMYGCGLRVSEVCGLTWSDLKRRREGGQATIFGKGSKTRACLQNPESSCCTFKANKNT